MLVPDEVVTVMSTGPDATAGGMVAVIWLLLHVMDPMLATLPKSTFGATPPL